MAFAGKGLIRSSVEKTRSGFESTILKELTDSQVPYQYEPKDKHLPYTVERKYIPDIVLENKKKTKRIYIELKGFFLTDDMAKMIAVKRCNPDLDIRFVFMSFKTAVQGARVRKKCGTKVTNKEWAEAHGFQCAEKHIPTSWIEELKA
jgi:hypothetical protein